MTWVIRNGELVEKTYERPSGRSSLPCPNIIRDGLLEPLQHMANGRWYDSKRAMEKADREAGCICVGNETPKQLPPEPMPSWHDEVGAAYQKVSQGYKPSEQTVKALPTKETGWFDE